MKTRTYPVGPGQYILGVLLLLVLLAGCETKQAANTGVPPTPPPMAKEAITATGSVMALDGAAATRMRGPQAFPQPMPGDIDRDRFEHVKPNPVKVVAEDPVSTFSIDVDTASYAVVRRYLNDGALPPRDAVRLEEMINYFDYDYPLPKSKDPPFSTTVYLYKTPWNPGTELLHIGIKGYDVVQKARPPANLVFLIDVSGSMKQPNKLPLVQKALRLLVNQLGSNDHVSIVAYAGYAGTVLEPTKGSDKAKILAAIDKLSAGGSTAGGEGIRQAYQLAQANYDPGSVNRVMLATDGDFNVGIADPERLKDFVAEKRKTGNYNDVMMQKLAQAGNGNAAYIDTLKEARKVLVTEMSSTIFPIAKDVKIQVEFNPAYVAEYRLIGYETRLLNREDFNNDQVDAGDVGSGHAVTALYEIVPVGSKARLTDPLRYGKEEAKPAPKEPGEIAFLKLRYKLPDSDKSELIEQPIRSDQLIAGKIPQEPRFAAAVAAFGERLRGDPYLKNFGYDAILKLAQGARGKDPFGYRAEFVDLVRAAKAIPALPAQVRSDPGQPQ
jgi:Ca-activated chloride channel family protein